MAVQPLSPATDRRLGGPLPRQLSNQTRAHLCAASLWYTRHVTRIHYAVLAAVSGCYPCTQRQITHALLTRPPLIRGRSPFTVRLECVMHAASVNPEPGSNSLKIVSYLHRSVVKTVSRAILAFTLLSYSMCFNEIPSHVFCSCFRSSVVQFSKTDAPLRTTFAMPATFPLYHALLPLSRPFFTFFQVFSVFSLAFSHVCTSLGLSAS